MARTGRPRPPAVGRASRFAVVLVGVLTVAAGCGDDAGREDARDAEPGAGSGAITALDAADGSRSWSSATRAARLTAVAVVSGTVLVWGSDECDHGAVIQAFDATSGAALWDAPAPVAGYGPFAVTTTADAVVVPTADGVALRNAASGEERWHRDLGWSPEVDPVADPDLVVVASPPQPPNAPGGELRRAATVVALEATGGGVRWEHELEPGHQVVGMATHPDAVIAEVWGPTGGSADPAVSVHALDRSSGELRWSTVVGLSERLRAPESTGPAVLVALDVTAWTTRDGRALPSSSAVVGLDVADGREVFRTERAADSIRGVALLAAAGDLAVVNDAGQTVAIDPALGTPRWRSDEAGAGATILPAGVLVAGHAGVLLDRTTGAPLWSAGVPFAAAAGSDTTVVLARSGSIPGGCRS